MRWAPSAPGRHDRLAAWLGDVGPGLDALVGSVEQLAYGGLIASRTTADPTTTIVARLDPLHALKRGPSAPTVFGLNLVTRISNGRDDLEEPPYWPQIGPDLYRLSQAMDRTEIGAAPNGEAVALRSGLAETSVRDWLGRRLRNHTVNLAAFELLAVGVLDVLVLSSDDTSPVGLPSREKRWLTEWGERLGLGDRLLMYPGADEVGCALVARAINARFGRVPRFAPRFTVPGGDEVTAAFEDGPVRITVERQVRAVGGTLAAADDDAAILLAVNPPLPNRPDWPPAVASSGDAERATHLAAMVDLCEARLAAGRAVAMADVAYANGTDPRLMDLLRERSWLPSLAAFGGWNTAGNTIGTVVAQAGLRPLARNDAARAAQERFLVHRFVEDWGYEQRLRPELRAWLVSTTGRPEPDPAAILTVVAWLEPRLDATIGALPAFADRYRIAPGSVRLPWRRTFEVDFDLEAMGP